MRYTSILLRGRFSCYLKNACIPSELTRMGFPPGTFCAETRDAFLYIRQKAPLPSPLPSAAFPPRTWGQGGRGRPQPSTIYSHLSPERGEGAVSAEASRGGNSSRTV